MFECKLDKRDWANCKNPKKYKVDHGNHTFKVRAIDKAGNKDKSPAERKCRRERPPGPRSGAGP